MTAKKQTNETAPEVARRSLNRGNARRIRAAGDALEAACNQFIAAVKPHVYVTNEKGERVGDWPVSEGVAKFAAELREQINLVLNPPEAEPAEDASEPQQ